MKGHDVDIRVVDDFATAQTITTIESGPDFRAPVTCALLFSKAPDGKGCSVAVAVDKDTNWSSRELMLAMHAFVTDFAQNTNFYSVEGPTEP